MFEEIEKYAMENNVPIVTNQSATFLADYCKKYQPKNILEIGTAIGYSGSLMLSNCKNAKLTTIEIDKTRYDIACQNFKKLNFDNSVVAILGDAKQEIEKLDEKFDLIFLDGPKAQYIHYLPKLSNLLAKDGAIIADNLFFHGMAFEQHPKHKNRTMIVNLQRFLAEIQNKQKYNTEIYEIGDGIAVIKNL